MAEAFAWLRRRLANRPDSEHGQALVRIVLILLILGYVLLPSSRGGLEPAQYRTVLAIVLTGLTLTGDDASRLSWLAEIELDAGEGTRDLPAGLPVRVAFETR